jgi:hypothetical protein
MIRVTTLAGPNRNGRPWAGYVYRGTKHDIPPVQARRSIIDRECPTCHTPPGRKCRTQDGRESNTYHRARRTVTS